MVRHIVGDGETKRGRKWDMVGEVEGHSEVPRQREVMKYGNTGGQGKMWMDRREGGGG